MYSLAIAVYCSSWTFYGAVGSAAGSSLSYLPIYLGPILLFLFGDRLLRRLTLAAKQHNITSIADFIAARFGRSHRLAAFVTVIAVIATIPYLALQFKAVAMSIDVLSGRGTANSPVLGDSALYIGVLLALFAILFGTRRIDATEHHHGMMLAIAVESVVKLVAFVAIGIYALSIGGFSAAIEPPLQALRTEGLPPGFITQTLLAYVAIFCLPRQFQVGVVECEDPSDVQRRAPAVPRLPASSSARWCCRSSRSAPGRVTPTAFRRTRICCGCRSRTATPSSPRSPTSADSRRRPAW